MVCEPYTKLLNSILTVDMAAAFVIMAAEVAQDLQIPRDRWVFSWASATCNDVYVCSKRWSQRVRNSCYGRVLRRIPPAFSFRRRFPGRSERRAQDSLLP